MANKMHMGEIRNTDKISVGKNLREETTSKI
jgi:hypothetical protein